MSIQPPASQRDFLVKNCSLSSIATGERASSLTELRDKLSTVDEGCLYHHFWGARMHPQFTQTQHHNDFARWVYHRLHDRILAEKLTIIDPTEFSSLEALRQEILETVERRLEEYDIVLSVRKDEQFHFISSAIMVFESRFVISAPEDLPKALPLLPPSSIFYHFIDARMRTAEKTDDFSIWLKMFNGQYESLIESIQAIDPYFLSLTQLREELSHVVQNHFDSRRAP